jgi:hypothetical protein
VFVSAVQDRYALKKSPTSASVGVGALGSVSLPFGSNDDSLVKVASSTVTDAGSIVASSSACSSTCRRRRASRPPAGHNPGARTGEHGPGLNVRGGWMGVALLLPALGAAATPLDCTQGLLQRLGWRFEDARSVHRRCGWPCVRAPRCRRLRRQAICACNGRRNARCSAQALLQQLLDDPATVCAYAFQLGQPRNVPLGIAGQCHVPLLRPAAGLDRLRPARRTRARLAAHAVSAVASCPSGNSHALQAFYSGAVRAECGVGRQVAQLATQRELYGDAAFDTDSQRKNCRSARSSRCTTPTASCWRTRR